MFCMNIAHLASIQGKQVPIATTIFFIYLPMLLEKNEYGFRICMTRGTFTWTGEIGLKSF